MAELASVLATERVPDGTNFLVAGPAMTRKRALLYELLAMGGGDDRATVLVTTRKSGDTVVDEYAEVHPHADDRLSVVDCVSKERGGRVTDTEHQRYATSAGDLTGIGIHASEFMRRYHRRDDVSGVGVGLHTLSTMLMYADLRRVYQFVHVLTGRVEAAGFVGGVVVDTPVADQSLDILKQPFDGFVEVRDDDDGPELRVRGVDVGPRSWTPF